MVLSLVLLLCRPWAWGQSTSPVPAASASASASPASGGSRLLPDKPVTHILLLDVSGSLRTRGYAARNASGWRSHWTEPYLTLLTHLLAPDGDMFRSTDRFVVQTFSEAATEAKEKNPVVGPSPLSDFVSDEKDFPAPGGGATNMMHGLDLDRQQADRVRADSGAVITWLITDNENNWQHSQDDRGFYQRMRDDPDYSFVHFFPIADPSRPGDSLVMYMLVHSTGGAAPWLPQMIDSTRKRIGADPILFRPLYTNPDQSGLEVKDIGYQAQGDDQSVNKAEVEGNTIVVHLNEGDALDGVISLKIRSTLKGWKVTDAKLNGQTDLAIPPGYKDLPEKQAVTWRFSPTALTVDPEGETSLYRLTPDGTPLKFERTPEEWLSSMGADWLKPVDGKFKMTATIDLKQNQIQPLQDEKVRSRLHFVHDLDKISDYMSYQADSHGASDSATRVITLERPLEIRIEAGGLGAWMLGLGALVLIVVLGLVGLALFMWKSHYTLQGPQGEEALVLPWLSGSHLVMEPAGGLLGRLQQSMGTLSFKPDDGVTVNGDPRPARVDLSGGDFRLELRREPAPSQVWTVSRTEKAGAHDAAAEGPVL